MVKTIKVIHLAPGESVLITAAPCPYATLSGCRKLSLCLRRIQNSSVILMQNIRRKRSSLFSALHDGGLAYVCHYNY